MTLASLNGGNGREPALAIRPALTEALDRQTKVLDKLAEPFADERAVATWTTEAYQAAVGRVNEGLVELLHGPDVAIFVAALLMDQTEVGAAFRSRLRRALGAVYARSLEDLSHISHELLPTNGINVGGLAPPAGTTTFR
jgi:hypothetical protein